MRWDSFDVNVSSQPWVQPTWARDERFDNASEAFRAFRAAIDNALSTAEPCRVYLVARAGRTAQTFGTFHWSGAHGS